MTPITAYKSTQGKAFQTPEGCLRAEFTAIKQELIAVINAWVLLPKVSLETQSAYIRAKLERLEEKGREYHEILQAKAPKPVELLQTPTQEKTANL